MHFNYRVILFLKRELCSHKKENIVIFKKRVALSFER